MQADLSSVARGGEVSENTPYLREGFGKHGYKTPFCKSNTPDFSKSCKSSTQNASIARNQIAETQH